MKSILLFLLALLFSISASVACAEDVQPTTKEMEIVKEGNIGVALWQCAVAAKVAGNTELSEKLFSSGHEKITRFFEYLVSGRGTAFTFLNSSHYLTSAGRIGESAAFYSGGVYTLISQDFVKRHLLHLDRDAMKFVAEKYMQDKNCQHLE